MPSSLSLLLCLTLAVSASLASPRKNLHTLHSRDNTSSDGAYILPMSDDDPDARANAITVKRNTFLYGPSVAGNTSFWPAGPLGNASVERDYAALRASEVYIETALSADESAVAAVFMNGSDIQQLSDYELLYKGQWNGTMPAGLDKGIFTNYTNDLLFSMERLSVNPYSTKRLDPNADSLPFKVDTAVVSNLTGVSLDSLLASGRLFYVDHRYQATLQRTSRYGAACDAYFYIHPVTGDFLPLAIRSNVGNDLVYTPLDSENDWLLAKMMFNLNDFWHSQWYHLANTHNVVEIVYEAAIRTLSDNHPVLGLLNRLTLQIFAFRISAITTLINPGGFIDQLFAFSGAAAGKTTSDLYQSGAAGAFQANYFIKNLASRNLINSTFGPDLKHFPFLDDAGVIHTTIQTFMTTFVDSYYPSESLLAQDKEIQAWIDEAKPAQIIDFPTTVDRAMLIDILTHVAFLVSASHQTLNTNDISEASGSLPFHPASLYQPVPTAKGVTDIIPFLPNATMSIGQIALTAAFARPEFVNSDLALSHMFDNSTMLARMNPEITAAAGAFQNSMETFSSLVSSRTFDNEGLSQGMPFIWKALDPERAPFYLTI